MIFTSFEIIPSRLKIKNVRLISSDGSYSINVNSAGYDLRFQLDKKAVAKLAINELNSKYNTNEFSEVF